MEIKQLEYVIMAADMGSFNKASEYLYTTQSNVSKVIRSLESELGYDIFRRQGNGVLLTDAGKILYEQSQQIMMMLKKFESFSDLQQKTCFHIASVVSNFIANHFAHFIQTQINKSLCLKMWEGNISRIIDLVSQGDAEIGFLYLGVKQRSSFQTLVQRKGLYFHTLLPARIVVCIGPTNPYYHKSIVSSSDLTDMEFIRCNEDNFSRTYHLLQVEKEFHLEKHMADAIEVESDYALINILLQTPRAYLSYGVTRNTSETFFQDVREIPIAYTDENIYLGYIHKEAEILSASAQLFLEQICTRQL